MHVRTLESKFAAASARCDGPACCNVTPAVCCSGRYCDMQLRSEQCLVRNCMGRMKLEYPPDLLYLDLSYLCWLFDAQYQAEAVPEKHKGMMNDGECDV